MDDLADETKEARIRWLEHVLAPDGILMGLVRQALAEIQEARREVEEIA